MRIRVRAARTLPTATALAILVVAAAWGAALTEQIAASHAPAARFLLAGAAGLFTVLLVETALPHTLDVSEARVRVRLGTQRWDLPRERIDQVTVAPTVWFLGRAAEVTFLDETGKRLHDQSILLSLRGGRRHVAGIAAGEALREALGKT